MLRLRVGDRQFLLGLAAALALICVAYFVLRPFVAVESARAPYLAAATDCLEARSILADLEVAELTDDAFRAAYRAALVPAMSCLEKSRIEAWLATVGVDQAKVTALSLEALRKADVSLSYLSREVGGR